MFQFKRFQLDDTSCAHKVGTDGTLLGAWTNISEAKKILDVGTGCGLIALMLAQRANTETKIEAIEIAEPDYKQAKKNIAQSPWTEKIKIHHTSFQEFQSLSKFDCIVSNPPFFVNSSKPPSESRTTPRHTDSLSFEDLISASKKIITPNGTLNVILPYTEGLQFIDLATKQLFYTTRQCSVRTRKEKPIERWLLEFCLKPRTIEISEILIHASQNEWSADYKNLTKDFYLKL